MTNAPAAPRPHVVEVPQPDQPVPVIPAPVTSSSSPSPEKVADFQRRFEQGYALEQTGKLVDARTIYDGILTEDGNAKRSLLEAGRISFQLGELPKADAYLSRLHAIVPDFPEAIELLIQINQRLKHDVKVELLVRDFITLHESGRVPQLTQSLSFVRERIDEGQDVVVVSQFFNYSRDPNTVWMGEEFDRKGNLLRRILLNYDPDATTALRARDAKYNSVRIFTWFEHKIVNQKVTELDAYLQIFALPDYEKFRSAMFVIMANPPKPIYSTPITAAQQ